MCTKYKLLIAPDWTEKGCPRQGLGRDIKLIMEGQVR